MPTDLRTLFQLSTLGSRWPKVLIFTTDHTNVGSVPSTQNSVCNALARLLFVHCASLLYMTLSRKPVFSTLFFDYLGSASNVM